MLFMNGGALDKIPFKSRLSAIAKSEKITSILPLYFHNPPFWHELIMIKKLLLGTKVDEADLVLYAAQEWMNHFLTLHCITLHYSDYDELCESR